MKHSRGVYYVKDTDLKEFMKEVDSDYQVCIVMFRWEDTDTLRCQSIGSVLEWMVVLQ